MSLSAAQAAAAVGMTKAGIIKAIREGRISGEKDQRGEWRVAPVELFRVYTPVDAGNGSVGTEVDASLPQHTAGLQREIELLREMLRDKDDQISDLRRRLDAQTDETQRLTALLEALKPPQPQRRPGPWWTRLLPQFSPG